MTNLGMTQGEARRRARELGGIAVSARLGKTGRWNIGGWPKANDVWIVIDRNRKTILDEGGPR